MATDGSIVEIEEQVALDSLPRNQSRTTSQGRKGENPESGVLTQKDKLVAYEAQLETNAKKSEVQVGPDGKTIDHKE